MHNFYITRNQLSIVFKLIKDLQNKLKRMVKKELCAAKIDGKHWKKFRHFSKLIHSSSNCRALTWKNGFASLYPNCLNWNVKILNKWLNVLSWTLKSHLNFQSKKISCVLFSVIFSRFLLDFPSNLIMCLFQHIFILFRWQPQIFSIKFNKLNCLITTSTPWCDSM